MNVEQLKNKTTSQLAELGKKTDAINRLKLELSEKNAAIFALEAREAEVKERLQHTEQDFSTKALALQAAEQALSDKQAELSERSQTAESRQVELVAVHTQIDALKARVEDAEKDFSATQQRLEQQRSESSAASRDLAEARDKVASLSLRVTDLDRQLTTQVREAESLGTRVRELEADNAELRRALAAGSNGNAAAKSVPSAEVERLRAEKAALEQELRSAREERAKTLRDLAAIQQQAESSWATERMENALLRERINDIAAEVAKLAMQLEGPNSPIETILAAEPERPKPANGTAAGPGGQAESRGTLADRIRALQAQASRARQIG
jgi:chromosome segregation ATPase